MAPSLFAEHARRLPDRHPVEVAQDEGCPLERRQRVEGCDHGLALNERGRLGCCFTDRDLANDQAQMAALLASQLPVMIGEPIACDSTQPGHGIGAPVA